MKKVIITILAIVYLATSSGAVINVHYCMGKLYSTDFSGENKCSKCGMTHAKNCCETKTKVLPAHEAHELISSANSFQHFFAVLPPTYPVYNVHLPLLASATSINNNSPPGYKPSLSILYCVFRI